jgi:hypothetical protein
VPKELTLTTRDVEVEAKVALAKAFARILSPALGGQWKQEVLSTTQKLPDGNTFACDMLSMSVICLSARRDEVSLRIALDFDKFVTGHDSPCGRQQPANGQTEAAPEVKHDTCDQMLGLLNIIGYSDSAKLREDAKQTFFNT